MSTQKLTLSVLPQNMNKKSILLIGSIIFLAILALGIWWILYLRKEHSTFENYYAFRGCVELLQKTEDHGTCRISSGEVIKIVEYQDRWFLDGDLPWACLGGICFGP